jgi:Xaa-Pro aminopeptidase
MGASRRQLLKSAGLAALGTGFLSRFDKVAAMQKAPSEPSTNGAAAPGSMIQALKSQATGESEKLLLKPKPGEEGPPDPATVDRLPLEWNKKTVQRFFDKLAKLDVQAFLVRNPLNTIYLTGYWHTTTERPEATFMNKGDQAPWFFYPALDRDLVTSWWFGDGLMYFDYVDDGAFPHLGIVEKGKTVDLFRHMLNGIKKHGIQGIKIGIDGELVPSEAAKAKEVLPGIEFVNVSDVLIGMRIVKTPEELALFRRAHALLDRADSFARDYILTHGTDVTDFEVAEAATVWGTNEMLSGLDLAGGQPHHGVGTSLHVGCRVGPLCGYPHPNQPRFARISRGQSLQVDGAAHIGGPGGENYRMFVIADQAGKFDPHHIKLWEVSQRCCDMQVEMQKEGAVCSDIAYASHKYQVEQGVQKYVYHRPGHGAGWEGHQLPELSLGDHTTLVRGMCFSEEPGLFDPETGCGFNWSDTVVTGLKSGYRMSRVPYSKEYLFIKL